MREVDCSFLLRQTLGEPLRSPEYFRQARVDEGVRTVVWPNGSRARASWRLDGATHRESCHSPKTSSRADRLRPVLTHFGPYVAVQHRQRQRDDGIGVTDHAGKGMAHHAATGCREHQKKRAEQLRKQTPPFLARILGLGR